MSEHHPSGDSRKKPELRQEGTEQQADVWNSWVKALYQWQETCDSTKCSLENQSILHKKAFSWAGPKGGKIWNWFQSKTNDPKDWGRIAWCEAERTFVGRLEEKHSMFERASLPEVNNPAAQVHNFLRTRCQWGFGRSVDIETKLESVTNSPSSEQSSDEFLEGAYARAYNTDLNPSREAGVADVDIRLRLESTEAENELSNQMELSHWALLFLWKSDIRLNNVAFGPEHWNAVDIPNGQAQRYERMRIFLNFVQREGFKIARASLATPFEKPDDVDPLDVRAACRILFEGLLLRVEQQIFPENFMKAVFVAGQQHA